jgi:hypothetical protein
MAEIMYFLLGVLVLTVFIFMIIFGPSNNKHRDYDN